MTLRTTAHDGLHEPDRLAEIRLELCRFTASSTEAVADLVPVCELSGRCCRFHEYGHTLFLSAAGSCPSAAEAPPPAGRSTTGERAPGKTHGPLHGREARPLGCRVYFCDPAYQEHAPTLSRDISRRLKRLAEEHDWPWNYAPLHAPPRAGPTPEPAGSAPPDLAMAVTTDRLGEPRRPPRRFCLDTTPSHQYS